MPATPFAHLLPAQPANPDGRYRVLLFHAHPDDESITCGATMAALSASGAEVVVLTSTRGELGEVIPEDLRHLEQGWPKPGRTLPPGVQPVLDGGAQLGRVRSAELAEALAALGAHGVFLGEASALIPGGVPRSYRDSGMVWGADGRAAADPQAAADSFAQADLEQAAQNAAALIRQLRPDVVISYAQDGGYGHPDHVKTHLLAHQAVAIAAAEPDRDNHAWDVPFFHEIVSDRPAANVASGTAAFTVEGDLAAKRSALEAHRTQVVVREDEFALSDLAFKPLIARESFSRVRVRKADQPAPSPAKEVFGLLAAGFIGGLITGIVGTILHLNGSGVFPWGAILSLVLLVAAMLWLGLRFNNALPSLVCGVVTYVVIAVLSIPHPDYGLVANNLAGQLWLCGTAILTLVCAVVAVTVLLRRNRRLKAARNA